MYWVTAPVHCLEALAGCPAIVVCDNLRSGVTRPHRYEPDVNATFAEMAAHYGVAIVPARAYKRAAAENADAAMVSTPIASNLATFTVARSRRRPREPPLCPPRRRSCSTARAATFLTGGGCSLD